MASEHPLSFALTITASPHASDQQARALRFAEAVHGAGYRLGQIFFYHDGVLAAHPDAPLRADWQSLTERSGCDLFVCVSAAERRGIQALEAPWQIVGLGDWVAGIDADRHLHFGG